MPLVGKGGEFTLALHDCRKWQTLSDLTRALEQVFAELHLTVLQSRASEKVIELAEFESFSQNKYRTQEYRDAAPYFYDADYEGWLTLWLQAPLDQAADPQTPETSRIPYIAMTALRFGETYNRITFRCRLNSRTAPDIPYIERYAESLMQLYVVMMRQLARVVEPWYGWIAEADEYDEHIRGQDVLDRKVNAIYWANYYGPGYLRPSLEHLFLTVPVGHVQHLGKSMWYQLHDKFEAVSDAEVSSIEQQVAAHFRSVSVDRIQWKYRAA